MKKLIAEFVGTFALVLVGTGAIVVNETHGFPGHFGISLAFGLIVMLMIFAFGKISGAHINPAVTLGLWTSNQFDSKQVIPYITSQISGGTAASLLLKISFPESKFLGATLPAGPAIQSFVLELLLTLILMLAILMISNWRKGTVLNCGVIIGTIIGLEAFFAGPITGASMNPARSIGPALASFHLEHLWIYLAAPTLGALLAVVCCRCIHGESCCTACQQEPNHA